MTETCFSASCGVFLFDIREGGQYAIIVVISLQWGKFPCAALQMPRERISAIVDTELRRAPRYSASLAVTILPRDAKSDHVVADPVVGRIVDLSLYGARLSVPRINSGACHLFYSFNDNPDRVLVLEILENDSAAGIVIPAHPVWFDHILSEPSRPFLLGMEFLIPPDSIPVRRLQELLVRERRAAGEARSGWLQRLFGAG
jgi:hypothetical protein